VAIFWPCRLDVQSYAAAGRGVAVPRLACPACRRPLIFWWWYERFVRSEGCHRISVRRGKCGRCEVTHALIPAFVLRRRLDPVAVIGGALARMIAGSGVRPVAEALGVPHTTVRSWRRRHRARAPALTAGFSALVVVFGGEAAALAADIERAALEATVAAWRQAARRSQAAIPSIWEFVSAITGGSWLGTTTSAPWAVLGAADFMPPVPQTPTEEGPGDP
jgi:transposase-like protein